MCSLIVSVRPVVSEKSLKYIGRVEFNGVMYTVARNCDSHEIAEKRATMVANHMNKAMEVVGKEYVLHFLQVDIS
jgi:hypothetical protein